MRTQIINLAITAVQVLFAAAFFTALAAATYEMLRTQPVMF